MNLPPLPGVLSGPLLRPCCPRPAAPTGELPRAADRHPGRGWRGALGVAAAALVVVLAGHPARGETAGAGTPGGSGAGGVAEVKSYLVGKLRRMTGAAHAFVEHAAEYQRLVEGDGGDYERAAAAHGAALLALVARMQGDYRVYHNDGYETIEGIVAGVRSMVSFDTYLDGGVPKSQASTDSPYSPLVLRTRDGRIVSDRNGNLFHDVIEPTLWGQKEQFVHRLGPEAAARWQPVTVLPRADVLAAAAADAARKLDELLAVATRWEPTMEECVGALVWMTPTLNGYFDDWRDSRYNPAAALGKYVAQSRVLDMRGIMSSLQITCRALVPGLRRKDPALAARLEAEYADILGFVARVDERERRSGGRLTAGQIEELAFQAKRLTDQLVPHLRQMAAVLNLRLPGKPSLA